MNADVKIDVEALKNMMSSQFTDFNQMSKDMGFDPIDASEEKVVVQMPFNPKLADARGALHGGVITTLLDTASGMCIFLKTQTLAPMATLDLRVDYFKPVVPGRGIISEVSCCYNSDKFANVKGIAYHDSEDDPVIGFTGAFMMNTSGPEFFRFPSLS